MRDTIKETNELRRGAANFQLRSTLQKGKPVGIGSVKLIEQWVFETGTVLFQRIIPALGIYSNQYRFERDGILSAWSGCFWIAATPRQFTVTPQFGYTEGLGKISPSLNGLFFDLVANASVHTNGNSPLEMVNPPNAPLPGLLTYETLTQRPSYDVKAFLRYNPSTFLFAAIGIEKSWGGEQMATNGKFVVAGLPVAIAQPNVSNARCTMKRSWGFSLAAMLCTVASIAGLRRSIAGSNDIDLTQWTPRES